MPLMKLTFKPGINRENTRYFTEGGWYEGDKIRFRQGSPEKIGGWTQYSPSKFLGVCRLLWNWVTLSNINLVAVGTNLKFYLTYGNLYFDITPIRVTTTLPNNPFVTVSGSSTVKVNATAHGAVVNDFVTYTGATTVAGLNLNNQFQITNIIDANSYNFTANGIANTSVPGGGGGASVVAAYQVNTGSAIQVPYIGWGSGTWGSGTWGTGSGIKNNLQLWNAYNYGENLLFGPRGGGIYYWVAGTGVTNVNTRGVALNTTGGTVTITNSATTLVPALITSSVTLPNNSSIQLGVTGGSLPTGLSTLTTYYVVNVLGTAFNLSLTQGGTPISTSSNGSGTFSISLLMDVPLFQNFIQVSDSSNFIIAFGANNYGAVVQDPMLIRWSDQQNTQVWYPDITNQAGSVRLSHGSQIITAIQTRQEIVVFTDAALYSLQYIGAPYVWGLQLLSESTTIMGPNAATVASGVVYWMGIDKFYIYSGGVAQTLNCDLRRFVFENLNTNQNEQVYCSTVEGFNEVWWFYVSGSGTQINAYVVYNYLENVWYYGTMGRTAWLDNTLQSYPIGATYNGYLCNQESGIDDYETGVAAPIDAYISSAEFDISSGDHFSFVWRVLPDVTFENSTSTTPTVVMTLLPMYDSGSGTNNPSSNTVQSYSITANPTTFTGQVWTRVRGRQMIFKMESTTLGTTWQLGAPRIDIRPDGRR
jgi:hypothetical protein